MAIRIRLKYPENDSFIELWQDVDSPRKYVGRYTSGPPEWVKICDPLGYCEMDYTYGPDQEFIVCDKKGNELFRSRNGDGSSEFNTPEQEAHEQMAAFLKSHSTNGLKVENVHINFYAHWFSGEPAGNLNQWLMSFQDPDLYKEADDYPENWIMKTENVGDPVVLAEYTYLGEKNKIEMYKIRHKVCGVEWFEYYSGGYYIGAEFDQENIGTMYTRNQAAKVLTEAIKSNFPDRYHISSVRKYEPYGSREPYYKETVHDINRAWEHLANGNYHREFIDRMAEDERKKSHFLRDKEEVKKMYPDCVLSYTY